MTERESSARSPSRRQRWRWVLLLSADKKHKTKKEKLTKSSWDLNDQNIIWQKHTVNSQVGTSGTFSEDEINFETNNQNDLPSFKKTKQRCNSCDVECKMIWNRCLVPSGVEKSWTWRSIRSIRSSRSQQGILKAEFWLPERFQHSHFKIMSELCSSFFFFLTPPTTFYKGHWSQKILKKWNIKLDELRLIYDSASKLRCSL